MTKNPTALAISALSLAVLGIGGYWIADWWTSGRYTESTNNAYIRADITTASSRVEGYVDDVLVEDNQVVKAGDLLVRMQQDAFQARLAQGRADLDKAIAAVETVASRLGLQNNLIDEAQAELEAMTADHELSVVELERAKGLVADNVASVQRFDIAVAENLRARARESGARANLAAVRQEREVLEMERLALSAGTDEKAAALELLQIELSQTECGHRLTALWATVRSGSGNSCALAPTLWPSYRWIRCGLWQISRKRN